MSYGCSVYYPFTLCLNFLIIRSKSKAKNPPKTPVQMSLAPLRPQVKKEDKECGLSIWSSCLLREILLQNDIVCGNDVIFRHMFVCTKLSFPGVTTDTRCRFNPCVGQIPWRHAWQPTPVFSPGESHGSRSLVGYSS